MIELHKILERLGFSLQNERKRMKVLCSFSYHKGLLFIHPVKEGKIGQIDAREKKDVYFLTFPSRE